MNFIIKGEISIETESGIRIGPRTMELFRLVKKTGSLNTAVKELGMSYSHAWNTLYKINCQLDAPLIVTRRGGKGGGVAYLTPDGEELLDRFLNLKREIQNIIKTNKIVTEQNSASA